MRPGLGSDGSWMTTIGTSCCRFAALLIAPLLCVGALIHASPAGATEVTTSPDLSWTAPIRVDQQSPFGVSLPLTSVSCPATTLCVAVDNAGDIVVSTDPVTTLTRKIPPEARALGAR